MDIKTITCTVCPIGCQIVVTGKNGIIESIVGNECNRGIPFATDEFILPKRILTTTIKITNSNEPLLPVRTDAPIPKDKQFDLMALLNKTVVAAPVRIGDVIISDALGLGANIIATKEAGIA